MRHVPVLLILVSAACADYLPATPVAVTPRPEAPPPPPQAPPVASTRDINVGETVDGIYGDGQTIHPGEHHFFVTPSTVGTLRATLIWDPSFQGTLLKLTLGEQVFQPQRPAWSPVTGTMAVEAGRRYRIIVSGAGADWIPNDRFTLTTTLEP
jgi:hypothetical protein